MQKGYTTTELVIAVIFISVMLYVVVFTLSKDEEFINRLSNTAKETGKPAFQALEKDE